MENNPVRDAGLRLAGVKRFGNPRQIAQAEADLAVAYLERCIRNAIDKGVDDATRRRLAETLIVGAPQGGGGAQ